MPSRLPELLKSQDDFLQALSESLALGYDMPLLTGF
jgi:hypothetical protein